MAIRVVLTGGGTGGHLFPLAAIADFMKENYSSQEEVEFLFIGRGDQMEQQIFGSRSIPIKKISTGKFRRYFSLEKFEAIFLKFPSELFSLFGTCFGICLMWFFQGRLCFSASGFGGKVLHDSSHHS